MGQSVFDKFGKSILDALSPSITDVIGKSAFDAIEKINFIESLNKTVLPFSNVYADIFSHSSRYFDDIARVNRDCSQLEEAGFLPHYTTPFDLLDECHCSDQLGLALERYYSENWAEVRREIEARLDGYEVDEEAKATFREALAAHGAGFYRSGCRLVFPELERIARKEIHNGSLAPIASMPGLKELADNLDTADTEAFGLYALEFYRRLSDHLYKHVRSAEDIREAEADPVPMRHAAMHGLVAYSTAKHSLNAVFMFDYVLQVVYADKRISREMERSDAA